uniref:SRA stem-loop interacting RNA binding protein n=1 Tax=Sphenodon punctatus TaxID=8508 RepID=A0A8D0L6F6_SPHPU
MAAALRRFPRSSFEVFVSRVPWTVASNDVKEYFSQFGIVKRCVLPFEKETGFHKGYCWVTFSSEEGFRNALQKDYHILEGTKIQVQLQQSSRRFSNQH